MRRRNLKAAILNYVKVRLYKRKYLEAVKQNVQQGDSSPTVSIPSKKLIVLGNLDPKLQQYVRALHQAGTPIVSSVSMAAKGIILSVDRTLLLENEGY